MLVHFQVSSGYNGDISKMHYIIMQHTATKYCQDPCYEYIFEKHKLQFMIKYIFVKKVWVPDVASLLGVS